MADRTPRGVPITLRRKRRAVEQDIRQLKHTMATLELSTIPDREDDLEQLKEDLVSHKARLAELEASLKQFDEEISDG
jgi:chromosome segregation ATPase